jgi:hypothetical protein
MPTGIGRPEADWAECSARRSAALRRVHLGAPARRGQPAPHTSGHTGTAALDLSTYQGAQISPAQHRPNADAQVTQTPGTYPNAPADRQAAPQVSDTIPYVGESPMGYQPNSQGWDAAVTGAMQPFWGCSTR